MYAEVCACNHMPHMLKPGISFCIENDFAEHFAKFCNLSIILIILEMVYFCTTGQIKIPCAASFYELLFKNYVYKTFAW